MSYTGQVFQIPLGQGGLVGTKNQALIQPGQLIVASGVSLYGGTLRKEGGAAKYNATAISGTPTILGGWDWWPSATTQRMVVLADNGNLYKDAGTGTFATTLASGLTVTNVVPVFVEGGKEVATSARKLFVFTGSNAVQVLSADGATTSNLATPPADWAGANQPSVGLIHKDRLWGAGNLNDPHRLYYSVATTHEDFTSAGSGSLPIYSGEGERIVDVVSFKGYIVVWKYPKGLYLVDTTDPSTTNWSVKRLTLGTGGISPCGHCLVDDDVMFIDPAGNIQLLSSVKEFGDMATHNLSWMYNIYTYINENVNLKLLNSAKMVYYPSKREVHLACTKKGSTFNDLRFVVDMNLENLTNLGQRYTSYRFLVSERDVPISIWLRKDTNNIPRLTIGDNVGFVWGLDQDTKSKDGNGYTGSWQTAYMDFSWIDPKLATVRKIGQFLEAVIEPTGNWNMRVDVYWDGVLTQTIQYNLGTTGAALGSFILGTNALAGNQIINKRKRLVGSGRRLSLAGSNNGAAEDFSIGTFFVECQVGDERQTGSS